MTLAISNGDAAGLTGVGIGDEIRIAAAVTAGQRFARLVTDVVVRVPGAWRVFRRPLEAMFDRLAPSWDATRTGAERLAALRAALEAIPDAPARVLDLGTGSGAAARIAASVWPDAEVVGVDLSRGMIDEARRLASRPRALRGRRRVEAAVRRRRVRRRAAEQHDPVLRRARPRRRARAATWRSPSGSEPTRRSTCPSTACAPSSAGAGFSARGGASAEGSGVVASVRRSRRGSTAPDAFAYGYTSAAWRGSSVGRAHG